MFQRDAHFYTFQYCADLRKLFIKMDKYVQVAFRVNDPNNIPEGLYVRALPVFALGNSYREVVRRCPSHASPSDAGNRNFPQVNKYVRWSFVSDFIFSSLGVLEPSYPRQL